MNCYNHPELNAVAVCQDCQKGLCPNCASKYQIPICTDCNTRRMQSEKSQIYKELFITFGLGAFATFFIMINYIQSQSSELQSGAMGNLTMTLMLFYFISSIVAGWKTLSGLTAKIFLALPIVGWLFYFFMKIMFSSMIGWFMLPIRTFNNIRRLKQIDAIPA